MGINKGSLGQTVLSIVRKYIKERKYYIFKIILLTYIKY
jgi:hypothetical protein